jgi:hypothetical protein
MTDPKIIPFGKYKGQPVEVLQTDPQYLEWLLNQPWFREKFITIHQTVINYIAQSTDTPEHNLLQARFLDPEFCQRFMRKAFNLEKFTGPQFEVNNVDVVFTGERISHIVSESKNWLFFVELKPTIGDDYPSVLRQIKSYDMIFHSSLIKKSVSIVAGRALCLEEFTARSVTREQFVRIFEMSNVKVVFMDELKPNGELE